MQSLQPAVVPYDGGDRRAGVLQGSKRMKLKIWREAAEEERKKKEEDRMTNGSTRYRLRPR